MFTTKRLGLYGLSGTSSTPRKGWPGETLSQRWSSSGYSSSIARSCSLSQNRAAARLPALTTGAGLRGLRTGKKRVIRVCCGSSGRSSRCTAHSMRRPNAIDRQRGLREATKTGGGGNNAAAHTGSQTHWCTPGGPTDTIRQPSDLMVVIC